MIDSYKILSGENPLLQQQGAGVAVDSEAPPKSTSTYQYSVFASPHCDPKPRLHASILVLYSANKVTLPWEYLLQQCPIPALPTTADLW